MRDASFREDDRLRSFRRPGLIAGVCAFGLVLSYTVAIRRPVPGWELDLTQWINDAPEWLADALYPVMQFGTLAGPLLVAVAIAIFRRDWALSATTVLTGLLTWYVAKGIKRIVDRGRPVEFLPGVAVREGDGSGLGYVSGHSAVAAAAAVMAMVAMPPRWRPVAALVAGSVGVARIVHGVHLPADVVGGWCVGTLIALAALWLLDLLEARRRRARLNERAVG